MKKTLTTVAFIAFFAAYGLYQYFGSQNAAAVVASNPAQDTTSFSSDTQTLTQNASSDSVQTTPAMQSQAVTASQSSSGSSQSQSSSQAVSQASTPVPTPAKTVTSSGQYTDGTYTGTAANAYYGYIQVQATVSGGKLANVSILQYPNDRRQSVEINSRALPTLVSEAVHAQSASVSAVSGASDTSAAFRQSLASALSQAKS